MHWHLLSGLVAALRTEANVRLAVLFGSVARGEGSAISDVDLLVVLRRDDHRAQASHQHRLEHAVDRRVQLVSLEQASDAPMLLADVLRDGRVLVDRDGGHSCCSVAPLSYAGRARPPGASSERRGPPPTLLRAFAIRAAVNCPATARGGFSVTSHFASATSRPHYEALVTALGDTPAAEFGNAARLRTPAALTQHVYPIERAFEIICNYVAELNDLGLRAAGVTPEGTQRGNLRQLVELGVMSQALGLELDRAVTARNELTHDYPDVRAARLYNAAEALSAAAPLYATAYATWLRALGFGQ